MISKKCTISGRKPGFPDYDGMENRPLIKTDPDDKCFPIP